MEHKDKRNTKCGGCGRSFLYIYDMKEAVSKGMTSYRLSCPFCKAVQTVPLQSVRKVPVLKGGTPQEITELTLPEHPIGTVEQ